MERWMYVPFLFSCKSGKNYNEWWKELQNKNDHMWCYIIQNIMKNQTWGISDWLFMINGCFCPWSLCFISCPINGTNNACSSQ